MFKQKTQVENISFPTGTAADIYSNDIQLLSGYDKLAGIFLVTSSAGNVTKTHRVGLQDKSGNEVLDMMPYKALELSPNATKKIEEMYYAVDVKAEGGRKINIKTEILETLQDDLSYDVVLLLERE